MTIPESSSLRTSDTIAAQPNSQFQDLLSISHTNSIFHVIAETPSMYTKVASMFKTAQQERNELQKKVSDKIRNWTHLLTMAVLNTLHKPEELKSLKKTVEKISSYGKVHLIRDQIQKNGMLNEDLNKELGRLQEVILGVLGSHPTSILSKRSVHPLLSITRPISITPPESSHETPFQSLSLPHNPHSRFIDYSIGHSFDEHLLEKNALQSAADFEETKRRLKLESKISNLLIYTPKYGEDWVEKLKNGFCKLSTNEEIIELGNKINALQAVNIIERLRHVRDQNWKLCILLGSLEPNTFKEVIHGFEKELIEHLNHIILNSPPKIKEHLIEQFENQLKEYFRFACNVLKEEIDQICGRLHSTDIKDINRRHIDEILELTNKALLDQEVVNKLPVLLKKVGLSPATQFLFYEDLPKEYYSYVLRLTAPVEKAEDPAGCVWQLLYLKVFCSNESTLNQQIEMYDDETTVDVFFGNWVIYFPLHYRELGIFANFSDEELTPIELNGRAIFPHKLAYDLLEVVGIEDVASLKRLHIYNRSMLQQYLNRDDIRKKIEAKIREMLLCSNNGASASSSSGH